MGREERRAVAEEKRRQAIDFKLKHQTKDAPEVTARCTQLGSSYGVGIGLYFQTMGWLRILFFWLALAAVPFMIVINTSQFTTPDHKGQMDGMGVSVLSSFNPLQSWTFAAIMDDSRDSGILSWMNIRLPGIEGVFPMNRQIFLLWIAIVDAGSMAVFSVACMVLYKKAAQFVKTVDDATMEVADYTVVVRGLPTGTKPQQIGEHFKRFGRVMDVVMVKDFGPLLSLSAQATTLKESHDKAKDRLEKGHNAVVYQKIEERAAKKLRKFYDKADEQLKEGLALKAVFVTFNSQSERAACQALCPRRWITHWFQHRDDRFERRCRFWVEQAKPPEDYIYENLHYSRLARYIRSVIVMLMVLAILIVSAAAVTKLMAMNISASRNIVWSDADMISKIDAAMLSHPLNSTQLPMAPSSAIATLAKIAEVTGDSSAASVTEPIALERLGYCSVALQQTCSEQMSRLLRTQVNMQPAERVQWANLADSLLKVKELYSQLQKWSDTESGSGDYPMCYPCYCNLLSKVAAVKVTDGDWVYSTKQECSAFITISYKNYLMKSMISFVVVILNIVLKQALQLLVSFEKHWTKSDQERHYAVMAFVSQLLNSVFVLILVNARSSSASSIINASLSGNKRTSWGANAILSGAYTDFTPSWYVDVGQSLEIIIILNAVLTVVTAWLFWLYRKLRQSCLMNVVVTASQGKYNDAWVGDQFVLDYRVSDMMLGLWIILMFGSGMPGLYIYGIAWLLLLDVTDRWYLAKMCQHPVRYGKNLPYLLLGVLPWAAATHCAFGVWMHTYFNAGNTQGLSNLTTTVTDKNANIASLAKTDIWRRVTQVNGLPLLILLILHLAIHVLIRFMIYFFSGAAFKSCSIELEDDLTAEVTYETALRLASDPKAPRNGKLAGTPTYRLPHHPRYRDLFGDHSAYKPLWLKAFGRDIYTQLVSRPGGGFKITQEPMLLFDDAEVHKLLEGIGAEAGGKSLKLPGGDKRHSLHTVGTGRDRSQSVNVTAMAGMGLDSPRTPGSPMSSSPANKGHRHSVMGPVTGLSPEAYMQGQGASAFAGFEGLRSQPTSSGPSFDGANQGGLTPEGVLLTAPVQLPGFGGIDGQRSHSGAGSLQGATRMSAELPHGFSVAEDLPVNFAGPNWYPEGYKQQAGRASQSEINATYQAAGGAEAYPAMAATGAGLHGGWVSLGPSADGERPPAAAAGWSGSGAAERPGSTGFERPGLADMVAGGERLWAGVVAASSPASRRASVTLTPYIDASLEAYAATQQQQQQQPSAEPGSNRLPGPEAGWSSNQQGSIRAPAFPVVSFNEPLAAPDHAEAYPNVHLTTVELPATHETVLREAVDHAAAAAQSSSASPVPGVPVGSQQHPAAAAGWVDSAVMPRQADPEADDSAAPAAAAQGDSVAAVQQASTGAADSDLPHIEAGWLPLPPGPQTSATAAATPEAAQIPDSPAVPDEAASFAAAMAAAAVQAAISNAGGAQEAAVSQGSRVNAVEHQLTEGESSSEPGTPRSQSGSPTKANGNAAVGAKKHKKHKKGKKKGHKG